MRILTAGWTAVVIAVGLLPALAAAQDPPYPGRVVRIISDSAAGSATDASARILADKLSAIWSQQVLTVNQPGAGGGISAREASDDGVGV